MSLSLRTINHAGQATPNPLAQTVQESLAKVVGYSELPIDGKWGDCSQQVLFSQFMASDNRLPTSEDLGNILRLKKIGIEGNVKLWDKKTGLYCPNAPAKDYKLNSEIGEEDSYAPIVMAARNFGVELPDEVLCDAGYAPDYAKGACIKKRFVPPKITLSQGPGVLQKIEPTLRSPPTFTFKPTAAPSPIAVPSPKAVPQAVDISSDKKYTFPLPGAKISPLDPSAFGTRTPQVAPLGPAMIGLIVVGVLVVGAGIVYASTRK